MYGETGLLHNKIALTATSQLSHDTLHHCCEQNHLLQDDEHGKTNYASEHIKGENANWTIKAPYVGKRERGWSGCTSELCCRKRLESSAVR